MSTEIDCNKIDPAKAAILLKALSNEKRLQILCNLLKGELCVNALEKMVGLSQSALSQHLAKLRASKLVTTRRDAQTIYYKVGEHSVLDLMGCLQNIFSKDDLSLSSAELEERAAE